MKNKLLFFTVISLILHLVLFQISGGKKQALRPVVFMGGGKEGYVFDRKLSELFLARSPKQSWAQKQRESRWLFAAGANRTPVPEKTYPSFPMPIYPPLAIHLKQEGTGIVKVKISKEGVVKEIVLKHSTGHELLDHAIIEAIKNWIPSSSRMTKKAAWIELPPFHFKLKEDPQGQRVSVSP